MKKLIFLIFLVSCSPNLKSTDVNKSFKFNDDLSFDEFNNLLIIYAEKSPYPNIDK
tara:strand:- start:225 stop:392 length:168 start_codon:yes stop_codon:yes gene_type:complete